MLVIWICLLLLLLQPLASSITPNRYRWGSNQSIFTVSLNWVEKTNLEQAGSRGIGELDGFEAGRVSDVGVSSSHDESSHDVDVIWQRCVVQCCRTTAIRMNSSAGSQTVHEKTPPQHKCMFSLPSGLRKQHRENFPQLTRNRFDWARVRILRHGSFAPANVVYLFLLRFYLEGRRQIHTKIHIAYHKFMHIHAVTINCSKRRRHPCRNSICISVLTPVNLSGWKYWIFSFSELWEVIAQYPYLPFTARILSASSNW